MSMRSSIGAVLALTGLFLAVAHAEEKVPKLEKIPDYLPAGVTNGWAKDRTDIVTMGRAHAEEVKKHNERWPVDVDPKTADGQQCLADKARLEANTRRYVLRVNQFNKQLVAGLEAYLAHLDQEVTETTKQFGGLGLNRRAEDFEGWADLATESRKKFKEEAFDAFVDLCFSGAMEGNKFAMRRIGSRNTFSAQKLIGQLESHHIQSDRLNALIREVGATKAKPELARKARELVEEFEKYGDVAGIAVEGSRNPGTDSMLNGAATIFSWGLEGPMAGFFQTDAQFAIASIYNNSAQWVSSYNISRLGDLTDSQLKLLRQLSERMEHLIQTRKRLRADVAEMKKRVD